MGTMPSTKKLAKVLVMKDIVTQKTATIAANLGTNVSVISWIEVNA